MRKWLSKPAEKGGTGVMAWKSTRAREPLGEEALYEYAVGALARRMRTAAELRRLMRTRVEPGETGAARIEAVVQRLEAQRYLDDHAFAADYTRLRQEGAKFGRRRVQQDLQRKGVAGEIAAPALEQAYAAIDEVDLARQYLARKRVRRPEDEKASARVIRLLVRGGFSLGSAYRVLRAWEVPEEALPEVTGDEEDSAPGGE